MGTTDQGISSLCKRRGQRFERVPLGSQPSARCCVAAMSWVSEGSYVQASVASPCSHSVQRGSSHSSEVPMASMKPRAGFEPGLLDFEAHALN